MDEKQFPEWYYDDDADDIEDDDTALEEDCGMMHGGLCMYAGSEFCDWDCPLERQSWRRK